MKKIALLVVLFISVVCQVCFAQPDIRQDRQVDPLLRQIASGQPGLNIFSRKQELDKYVNMAVLDDSKKLKFFTCYGIVFDSVQLTNEESAQIVSKILDPFVFYKKYNYDAISRIEKAETLFRLEGQKALLDTSYNCQLVFNAAPVKSAQSTLQKLMAIEGFLKRLCLYLRLFDARSPQHLPGKDASQFRQEFAGSMIKKGDSTEYYNVSALSTVWKIVLRKQDPGKLFVYDLENSIIDSVPLKSAKYTALLEQKQDVFLLYRGWLELQWQQLLNEQMSGADHFLTQDSGYYAPANIAEENEQFQNWLLQIKAQRDVVEKKISRLIVPEGIYVEKLIRSFYSEQPSEISYLPGLGFAYSMSYVRGQKVYEMTDHRRNVMAIINDRKKPVDGDHDGVIDYYNADVVNAADYYPFGMLEPGRAFGAGEDYRYGYNGKENDNEAKGEGNQQDYGMRIYDPRIGRFLSVDPLARFYPGNSAYAFAENSPVNFIDLDGLEKFSQQQLNSIKSQNEAKLKVMKQNARLRAIALKGGADAALNANSLGLTDFFGGTNNVNKYATTEEREAYLRGRVGGDIASIFTGTAEIPTGGAIAASTGLETAGVGAAVGGVVSGHGALTGLIASADLGASLRELYNLNVEGTSGGDVSASTNNETNSAHGGNPAAGNSNTTGSGSNVPDVSWKGFSKGSLDVHNTKHGAEFGSTGAPDYLKQAKAFGAKVGSGIKTVVEGNFLIKYEESTSTILIGHIKDREIRTFYKASPEHTKIDPLTDAINFAKSLSKPK